MGETLRRRRHDLLSFNAGISKDNLWLWQVGKDLRVGIRNTQDWVTLSGWYSDTGPNYNVDADNGASHLVAANVQQLVNAMASFNPETQGNLFVPQSAFDAAAPVIAAAWT